MLKHVGLQEGVYTIPGTCFCSSVLIKGILATPPSNKGLIFGLVKGNQWLITLNKAGYFLGGVALGGGVARIPMI